MSKLQPKITVPHIKQFRMKQLQMSSRTFQRLISLEFKPEIGELILAIKVRVPFLS